MKPGDLTPGIPYEEYRSRRQQFATSFLGDARLGGDAQMAIITSDPQRILNGVIPLPYRFDSNFFYLTGITEPGPVAMIERRDNHGVGSGDDFVYTLFVPQQTAEDVRWNGRSLSIEGALGVFGAHEAYPLSMFEQVLQKKLAKASASDAARAGRIVADRHKLLDAGLAQVSPTLSRYLDACSSDPSAARGGGTHTSLDWKVSQMRWRKSESELALMREAAAISADAFNVCIGRGSAGSRAASVGSAREDGVCVAGGFEDSVMARFQYECHRRGARHMAYPPVCASGANSVAVHYCDNQQTIRNGELFLMDAGCELHGYCSDITRTWAVDGVCTSAQRAVMDIVLHTLNVCTNAINNGGSSVSLHDLHMLSVVELSRGLIDLGVCKGTVSSVVQSGAYRPYYPHSVGHWLGLETHDTPHIPSHRSLEAGAVLTLEPGLYFSNESGAPGAGHRSTLAKMGEVPKYLRGIGIRIEDDIVVAKDGSPEVITLGVPRDLDHTG